MNKRKILIAVVIFTFCSFILNLSLSMTNDGPAKNVLFQYTLKRHEAIQKLRPGNYEGIVGSQDLKNYAIQRDKLNIAIFKKSGKKYSGYNFGSGYRSSFYFFGWYVINDLAETNFPGFEESTSSGFKREVKHIVLLKKCNGKWYIEKDIFDANGSPAFIQILNPGYTAQRIQDVNEAFKNLDIYADWYRNFD